MPDDKKDSLLDAAKQRIAVEAATAAVSSAASRAGDGFLDALESVLFGKVGEADKVVAREEHADPLERLRAQYGQSGDEVEHAVAPAPVKPVAPTAADRLAKAQVELDRLKAAKTGGKTEPAPPKKTL